MASTRAEEHRLARLVILVALAVAGQVIARMIAGSYVVDLGAPAQHVSVATDLILLACVPFGYFLAPKLSIRVLPLIEDGNFNRALFRSLVLALISLAAGIVISQLPHTRASGSGTIAPIPLPLGIVLAIAAAFREEIEFRLGLLTVVAWILYKLVRDKRSPALWTANIAQSIAFGALHQIAGFTGRTSLSIIGVMLDPRTVGGLVIGYAYITYGLETAILTHVIGDSAVLALAALLPA